MAKTLVQALPFWLDGMRLRALARSVDLQLERDAVEQTTFGATAVVNVAGLRNLTLNATLLADAIQGQSPPAPQSATAFLVSVGGDAETDGSAVYSFVGRLTALSWGGAPGDALEPQISLAAEVAAGGRGLILAPDAARTASGAGTGRQFGALASGARLLAGVHVFSVSGTSPSLTVTLQSDDASDFPSPVARATLGPLTSAGAAWAVVDGPVSDDWWRVSWTISGTSPSIQFAAVIAA